MFNKTCWVLSLSQRDVNSFLDNSKSNSLLNILLTFSSSNKKLYKSSCKEILLKNGFKEAEFYVENRLWKWKFFKVTSEDVAFVINLELSYDLTKSSITKSMSEIFAKISSFADFKAAKVSLFLVHRIVL